MSSSSSQALVSYSSSQVNPMLLMENLLSVAKESNGAIQLEILKTSQAVSAFIEQMTEQFRMMAQRIAELESSALIANMQSQEIKKMHEAQLRAIEQLTATVMFTNQELGVLKSDTSSIKTRATILEAKLSHHTHAITLYEADPTCHPTAGCLYQSHHPGFYARTLITTGSN